MKHQKRLLPWLGLFALALTACSDEQAEPTPCGGFCPVEECIENMCVRTRTIIDMMVPPDAEPDTLAIIDAMPPPSEAGLDMAMVPDAEPPALDMTPAQTDMAPAAPDAALIPDMTVDAACVPAEESCNGLDDDCDDLVDEGELPPGDPCATGFEGICAEGAWICTDGVRACEGALPFATDACDTLDNDCDGEIDEDGPAVGDPCDSGDPGVCQLGRIECDAAGEYVCRAQFEAVEETCDGRDNDCDGQFDESDPLVGSECDSGELGACTRGQQLCQNGALVCIPLIAPGTVAEVCNNIDDNCNGVIDEDLPVDPQPCRTDLLGECQAGRTLCEAGRIICVPEVPPQAELCNALDDDCDGSLDEDFDDLLAACTVGQGACARVGHLVCDREALTTSCSARPGPARPERCDGIDNDCDGEVDNLQAAPQEPDNCGGCGVVCDFPNAFSVCEDSVCRMGNCRRGYLDVDGEPENGCEWGCQPTDPPEERCDGLDNDCDGFIDGDAVCGGPEQDAFAFCLDRRELGAMDRICDDFSINQLGDEYWAGSLVRAGDDVPGADRAYGAGSVLESGGGHTRRVPRVGPSFRMGMHLTMRGPMSIGLYDSLVERADQVTLPHVLTTGNGARYFVGQGYLVNDPDRPFFSYNQSNEGDRLPNGLSLVINQQRVATGPYARREDEGRTLVFGPVEVHPGLFVTRRFTASATGGHLRIFDTLDNRNDEAMTLRTTHDAELKVRQRRRCEAGLTSDGDNVMETTDDWMVLGAYQPVAGMSHMGVVFSSPEASVEPDAATCANRNQYGFTSSVASRWAAQFEFEVPPRARRALLNFAVMGDEEQVVSELMWLSGRRAEVMGRCGGEPDARPCRADEHCAETLGWCNDDPATETRCRADADCADDEPCVGHVPAAGCVGFEADPAGVPDEIFAGLTAEDRAQVVNMAVPAGGEVEGPQGGPDFSPGAGYALHLERRDGVVHGRVVRSPDDRVLWDGPLAALGDQNRHWVQWTRTAQGAWRIDVDGRTMPPLRAVDDDLTYPVLDRLSFWLGPDLAGPGLIDGLAIQYDDDGDDVYPPLDNCPYTYNPAQEDTDQNGRGLACDDRDGDGVEDGLDLCVLTYNPQQLDADLDGQGDACQYDGSLMVGQVQSGTLAPWAVDLRTGRQGRLAELPGGATHMRRSPSGRYVWSWEQNIQFINDAGERQFLAVDRMEPEWWGERLVMVNGDRTEVSWLDIEEGESRVLARSEGGRLRARPAGDRVVISEFDGELGRVWTVDAEGEVVDPPLRMESAGLLGLPWVIRHPARSLYYVVGAMGDTQGLSILEGDTGLLTGVHARPTDQIAIAPNGRQLFTTETTAAGVRVMVFELDDAGWVVDEGRVLLNPSTNLVADELDWILAEPPAIDDADGDGLADEDDPCDDYGQVVSFTPRHIGQGQHPRLISQPDGLLLTSFHGRMNPNGLGYATSGERYSASVARLDSNGTVLVRAQLGYMAATMPAPVDDYRGGIDPNRDPNPQGHPIDPDNQPRAYSYPPLRPVFSPSIRWYRGNYHLTDVRTQSPLLFIDDTPYGATFAFTESVHHRWSADLTPERLFVSGTVGRHSRYPTPPFRLGEDLVSWHATGQEDGFEPGHYLVFGPEGSLRRRQEAGRVGSYHEQFVVHDGRVHVANRLRNEVKIATLRDDLGTGPEGTIPTGRAPGVMIGFGDELVYARTLADQIHLYSVLPGGADAAAINLTADPEDVSGRTNEINRESWDLSLMVAGDKLALMWVGREPDITNPMVFFRTFDRRLRPLQPVTRLTPPEANVARAHMVWDGQAFALVWADMRVPGVDTPELYFAYGRADCK